jgi:hypothetical protein
MPPLRGWCTADAHVAALRVTSMLDPPAHA